MTHSFPTRRSSDLHETATGDGDQRKGPDAGAAFVLFPVPANRKRQRIGQGEADDMGKRLLPGRDRHHAADPPPWPLAIPSAEPRSASPLLTAKARPPRSFSGLRAPPYLSDNRLV